MIAILITCVFGLTSFCLIVVVCNKALRPATSLATRQNIVELSASPVATSAALLKIDGGGEFLKIKTTCKLTFPKSAFRPDNSASLRFGAPFQPRFQPVSMQEQPNSPLV